MWLNENGFLKTNAGVLCFLLYSKKTHKGLVGKRLIREMVSSIGKRMALAIEEPKRLKIRKIEEAPYICTIPRRGIQAIKCYPDAKSIMYNGNVVGFSPKEETLIVLPNSGITVSPITGEISDHVRTRIEASIKMVMCNGD